jgi:hypothetical protein
MTVTGRERMVNILHHFFNKQAIGQFDKIEVTTDVIDE